jgi:hypothetical protein
VIGEHSIKTCEVFKTSQVFISDNSIHRSSVGTMKSFLLADYSLNNLKIIQLKISTTVIAITQQIKSSKKG